MEERPIEPNVSNENPEQWCAIAEWETERADSLTHQLKEKEAEIERYKSIFVYNTPEFLESLSREGVSIFKEYKDKTAIPYSVMIIGFYKRWCKKLLSPPTPEAKEPE